MCISTIAVKKAVRRVFGTRNRRMQNLQINNHEGGCINLYFLDCSKEEIDQLILENKSYLNE